MSERAYVALGSNLGDREKRLVDALAALGASEGIEVAGVSAVYETAPVGPPGQGPYLNAVVAVETELAPAALLARLHAIEAAAGRERSGVRNEARALDLDLLLQGDRRIDEPGLRVPHPRLHERGFVLEPLSDLAPRLRHPELGESIEELASRVRDRGAVRRREAPLPGFEYDPRFRAPEPDPTMSAAEPRPSLEDSGALALIESGEAEAWSSEQLLRWAFETFQPRIALSCSFGNPEGLVLLDMLQAIEPEARVFVLDTGRLPQETYDLIDRVRDRYDKSVEVVFPDAEAVQAMVRKGGMNLFYESLENRLLCCRLRKVEPNRRYLSGLDAYVTGLRREQNVTRSDALKLAIDENHGIVKVNPLVEWTQDEIWKYVRAHDVPVNRLHQAGYPSVGCAPCTRAVRPGEDPRAGRWWWENPETKECGLHVEEESEGSGI